VWLAAAVTRYSYIVWVDRSQGKKERRKEGKILRKVKYVRIFISVI